MFQIKLIKSAVELSENSEKWNDLLEKQVKTSPYHTTSWLMTCFEAFPDDIVIGVIESDGKYYAAAAANIFKGQGGAFLKTVKVLSFEPKIGTVRPGSLIALIDPSSEELPLNEMIEMIFAYLKWDVLFFQYWNDEVEWLKEPVQKYIEKRKMIKVEGFSSVEAWISTELSMGDYYKNRSTKLRSNLSNAQNRILKIGNTTFCELCDSKKEWIEIESIIIDIYKKSWQFESNDSPLSELTREHVLKSCRLFYEQGCFSVILLSIDSNPVSFLASFIHRDILYPMAIGYNKHFENLSVGGLLIKNSYGYYKNRGIKGIYFGPIREESRTAYKRKWATEIIIVPNILIIRPFSIYGLIHFLYSKSKLFKKIYWYLFKSTR